MAISHADVKSYINDIATRIGVRDPVPTMSMFSLLADNKVNEVVKQIALALNLRNQIRISYVSRGGSGAASFKTKYLTRTDRGGKGVEAIFAQVMIPSTIPMFGTEAFDRFVIEIKVGQRPSQDGAAFAAVLAHELSHVVLHSIRHPEKDNEVYTDLTAMCLGFVDVMAVGRKTEESEVKGNIVETTTTTYGYLSDNEFQYAENLIWSLIKEHQKRKNRSKEKIFQAHEFHRAAVEEMKRIYILRDQVEKRPPNRIIKKDVGEISQIYQLGFLETANDEIGFYPKVEQEILEKISKLGPLWNSSAEKEANDLIEEASRLELSASQSFQKFKALNRILFRNCSLHFIFSARLNQLGNILISPFLKFDWFKNIFK